MVCSVCRKKFHDGDRVIPIQRYVTNVRRGDFVNNATVTEAAHFLCLNNPAA